MVICAVINCSNRSGRDSNISYFNFPRIIENKGVKMKETSLRRRQQWLARLNRADLNNSNLKYRKVCSDHFIQGKPSRLLDETNPDWAPSVKLGHSKYKVDSNQAIDRYARVCQRKHLEEKKIVSSPTADNKLATTSFPDAEDELSTTSFSDAEDELSTPADDSVNQMATGEHEKWKTVEVQTDFTMQHIQQMEMEMANLRKEKEVLKKKSNIDLTEEIVHDDQKTQFYTGLPSGQILKIVYEFISPRVTYKPISLSHFQSFLIFMLRLRLNLLFQDIAYRFAIGKSTVARIFHSWLDGAFLSMAPTIIWPERSVLKQNIPTDFLKAFGTSVAVTIDCFEIMIDRPSSLASRAATWSNYKHHNTAKVLIGISPHGVITFVSEAWGGRVSDKYITENCGILEKLLPGDFVLADRGFNISDAVGLYCAKVIKPSSAKGKTQLSPEEIQQTRELAALRIHVERVIGNLRQKYTILKGQLPVECLTVREGDEMAPIDNIIKICAAFTNLSSSIIPLM